MADRCRGGLLEMDIVELAVFQTEFNLAGAGSLGLYGKVFHGCVLLKKIYGQTGGPVVLS